MSTAEQGTENELARVQRVAADQLERDIDDVASAVADAVTHEIEEVPNDPQTREDVRRRSRVILLRFLEDICASASPDVIEVPVEATGWVRALARAGVPLSVVLRVNSVGLRIFLQAWDDRLGVTGVREDVVLAATRSVMRYTFSYHDVHNVRLSEEYRQERETWVRGAQAARRG